MDKRRTACAEITLLTFLLEGWWIALHIDVWWSYLLIAGPPTIFAGWWALLSAFPSESV